MNNFFEQLTDVCHNLLLDNKKIMNYLKVNRGMNERAISDYKLGAFPNDLRDLYNRYNMNAKELVEKNIIWNASQSQFRLFPIVIPIQNIEGKSVAIGCRTLLGDEERKEMGIPKYRNSNYKKTHYLFGLNKAIKGIREKNGVFVVEGYFDVITAYRKGISNVVATCGTIFSQRQLMTLSRYTNNICLLFDNDPPGRRSAKSAKDRFSEFDDVNITCKFTPSGYKDLDEYLINGGNIDLLEG